MLALGAAAGAADDEATRSTLGHVSQCVYCSSLLRCAMEDLTREASPEEAALAGSIAPPSPRVRPHRQKWPLAIAAAVSVIGLFSFYYLRSQPDEISTLLAQAYSDARPFDWRLPDSGYAPVRLQRGSPGAASAALRTAQMEIGRQPSPSAKHRGWIGVLDAQDPSPTIATLEDAIQAAPSDVETLNLLGVAYARRADLTDSESDFRLAVSAWARALAVQPHHAAIRYNHALGLTRLKQYPVAIAEWQSLLQDTLPGDSWRSEIQQQLERAKSSYAP